MDSCFEPNRLAWHRQANGYDIKTPTLPITPEANPKPHTIHMGAMAWNKTKRSRVTT